MLSQTQTGYVPTAFTYGGVNLKVALAGDGGVGKTSLCSALATGKIPTSYNMTIGVDICCMPVSLNGQQIKLVLWDLAGQDRFDCVRENFYRGSQVAIIVFSLANRGSFYDLNNWVREIQREAPGTPFIIVGNKKDLNREVSHEEANRVATAFGAPYYETSASSGDNVKEIFYQATLLAYKSAGAPVSY